MYYFFKNEYGRLRTGPDKLVTHDHAKASRINEQPPILQRLLIAMGYHPLFLAPAVLDGDDEEDYRQSRKPNSLSYNFFYVGRDWHHPRSPLTLWSDAPYSANTPNEGWRYYCKHSTDCVDWRSDDVDRGPVICFLSWGYCMWDQERLHKWRLLEGGRQTKKRWLNMNSGGYSCDHTGCKIRARYPV